MKEDFKISQGCHPKCSEYQYSNYWFLHRLLEQTVHVKFVEADKNRHPYQGWVNFFVGSWHHWVMDYQRAASFKLKII